MSERVEIRRVVAGDIEAMAHLRERAGRPPLDHGEARDRWLLGPGGGVAIGAFGPDRLLGLLTALPRVMRTGDKSVPIAEMGETLVDPDVPARGVRRFLLDEMVADLARHDVEALGCLMGSESSELPGDGFERAQTILTCLHVSTGDRLPRPSPDIDIERDTEVGSDYDGLDEDLASDHVLTIRSADHLRRRYLSHPAPYTLLSLRRGRRLEGWLVLLAKERDEGALDGWLVDSLVWPDHSVRRSATAAALRWFAGQGCSRMFTWRADSPQDPDPLMEPRPGRRPAPHPRRLDYLVRPIRPGGRALLRKGLQPRWVFRPGDTDVA